MDDSMKEILERLNRLSPRDDVKNKPKLKSAGLHIISSREKSNRKVEPTITELTSIVQAREIKELTKLVEEQKDEITRLEKLNANLLRISRERANADRNLRPKKSRSGYWLTQYDEVRYSYHEGDEKISVPLYKTVILCPYTASFDWSVASAQIMHELRDDSKGPSILTQLGIDKVYEKSEFYEDMIKDHEWCQNPDDYNIALQPKLGIRRDYWYISMMLTKGVRAFPADLRRI